MAGLTIEERQKLNEFVSTASPDAIQQLFDQIIDQINREREEAAKERHTVTYMFNYPSAPELNRAIAKIQGYAKNCKLGTLALRDDKENDQVVKVIADILGIRDDQIGRKYKSAQGNEIISLQIRETVPISDEDNYQIFEKTGYSRVLKAFGYWHLAKQQEGMI